MKKICSKCKNFFAGDLNVFKGWKGVKGKSEQVTYLLCRGCLEDLKCVVKNSCNEYAKKHFPSSYTPPELIKKVKPRIITGWTGDFKLPKA